jgi:hypothetical protein
MIESPTLICLIMPSRRLEDHIRELCHQLKHASSDEQVLSIAADLRVALREHARRLEQFAQL